MQSLIVRSRQFFYAGCVSLTVISTPFIGLAVTVEEVPKPQQADGSWISDMANILNTSTETKLNQMISQLESENGTEIAVVTVPNTAPSETPKAFATQLFNYWKIGKSDRNNGVLFLVSKGDLRVEIETGYGIEPVLPNAQVDGIIQQKIIPPFKQGNFDQGTLNGTEALATALRTKTFQVSSSGVQAPEVQPAISPNQSSTSNSGGSNWLPLIGLGIVGLSLLFGLMALANNNDDDHRGDGGRRSRRYSSYPGGGYNSGSSSSTSGGYSSGGYSGSSSSDSSGGGCSGSSSSGSSGGCGGGSSGGGGGGGGF